VPPVKDPPETEPPENVPPVNVPPEMVAVLIAPVTLKVPAIAVLP